MLRQLKVQHIGRKNNDHSSNNDSSRNKYDCPRLLCTTPNSRGDVFTAISHKDKLTPGFRISTGKTKQQRTHLRQFNKLLTKHNTTHPSDLHKIEHIRGEPQIIDPKWKIKPSENL